MPKTNRTDARIRGLLPRKTSYDIRDGGLKGFGVRVTPSGRKRFFVHCQHRGERVWKRPVHSPHAVPTFQEFVEGEWKGVHFERCKPTTRKTYSWLLDVRLLPAFGEKRLDRIAPAEVRRWFDDFSRTAPGNANVALKLLRPILNFAVARGHIETNPARGIAPNRRPRMTRFLSSEEIARLHRLLDAHSSRRGLGSRSGASAAQADIIRLLLLTGCRRNEIVRLRWSEVQNDTLVLADSKVGPRNVPLNARARAILDGRPKGESPFVFPSPRDPSRPYGDQLSLWNRVRRETDIQDVRLHDLRHTHASHAVMNNVPVPVVSRLLGHSSVRMTLRYAHLGDREIEEAAERVGQSIAALMGLGTQQHPIDTSSGGSSG